MLKADKTELKLNFPTLKGDFNGSGLRIAIICSTFNTKISKGLVEGALKGLKQAGLKDNDISVALVPGAFELASTAAKFASNEDIDAVICLGCVIRGDTAHFDYVCQGATQGITQVGIDYELPVIFGVLTTDTLDQAIERASDNDENKGLEAAQTAIQMATLFKQI